MLSDVIKAIEETGNAYSIRVSELTPGTYTISFVIKPEARNV